MGEKGTPIVLFTVDIPDEKVLLSDFDYWHFVLNDVAIDTEFDMQDTWSEEDKRKSWEKIFDIECTFDCQSGLYLSTQATMWEIRSEWVLAAEVFTSR